VREASVFILFFMVLLGMFLFRLWNIDLIVEQRYRGVAGVLTPVFRLGREVLDESKIVWGNAPVETRSSAEILNTSSYHNYGRFLRTYRWHRIIRKAEQRYRIEENLLAGLIMQESMGNPLELNSGDDGGAGLMMFQPGTARQYGLKTFGTSKNTGRDIAHGRQLRNLVIQRKFSYTELSRLDERFHVEKSVNAGARFLSELYERHHSWDKALSAYNRGKPSAFPAATRHVRQVRHFQRQYASFLKKES
jgi:soluble lytic murein transglycosylase-like protein